MASNSHFAHMCHLRRILPQKNGEPGGPSSQIASLILLDTYVKFGRNHDLCDVVLTSTFSSSNMISRDHAEINAVKAASGRIEKYMITDHSLNGTYINDRRCQNNVPTQINEGDIIKFGHMNGASIKGGQVAPQANAEFAFVVERANPAYSYLGFRDGRRARPLVCRGEMEVCQETELTRKNTMPQQNQMPHQPMPQTTVSQAAAAANQANQNAMNQFLQGIPPQLAAQLYSYQLQQSSIPTIFAQQAAAAAWNLPQNISGFRAPNVSNLLASSIAAGMPPSTSASLLSRGLLPGMVNPLLTPVTAAAVAAATSAGVHPTQDSLISATMTSSSPAVMTQTQMRPEDLKEEVKMRPVQKNDVASGCEKISTPHVASPPMECDSSVPSPPKPQHAKKEMISPKAKEEERSDADSPPMRRGANTAPTPWDSSPSPRPRDTPDRESVKEDRESEKEMMTTTKRTPAPVVKHRKTNEIARLLDDITEGSFANQMRRASTSRRPTDDEMCEKNAKKEKKKFQKEKEKAKKNDNKKTVSTVGRPPARRMKQLSDESSASSDSDSEEPSSPVKREPPKRKREPSISSAESASIDSEDSSKPKKKHKTKGRPRKTEKKENRGRKPKVQPKPAYSSEEDEEELDPDSELVTTHDPASVCGLNSQCTQPQSLHVNWVCCDDCDKWYHTICILGVEKEINEPEFHCGCKKHEKTKKKGRK